MTMPYARSFAAGLLALATIGTAASAAAQAWPAKPIQIIIPAAAGSGPDVTMRTYTDRMSKNLNQSVVITNRPGANGIIGAQAAAKAPADGYTFFEASIGQLVVNKYPIKDLGYDPDKDFVPVAMLGRAPYMVLVNPDLPIKSLGDLVAFEKERAGKVFFAYEGSSVQAATAYLIKTMNIRGDLVSYVSPVQAINDTIGGLAHVHIQGTAIGLTHVNSGKLRPIAVTTDVRIPQIANVPTMNESYPGFGSFEAWLMLVAPAGTPPDAVRAMSAEIGKVGSTPELQQIHSNIGFLKLNDFSPTAAAAFLKAQSEQFAKMAAAANLKPE
jgi:tripartite-type tricarboxylate transporter receptor subunit TctC